MTPAFAAFAGDVDALRWVVENGCPWDKKTRDYAAMNNQEATLRWAIENGCPEE
jgi:hypothetical protein